MRRNVLRPELSVALLLFFFLYGSFAVGLNQPDQQFPDFQSTILPIFEANCLICHGTNLQKNGLDLRTYKSVLKGGDSGPVIVPGSASRSLLFEKISSGAMPLGGNRLTAEQIERIRSWIDSGALMKSGIATEEKLGLKTHRITHREVMMTILNVRCVVCHGRRKQEGRLDVRTRASLLKGGRSGPAMVAGKPEESLLIKRIASGDMPPLALQRAYAVRPVTSNELEKLRQWILDGAPEEPEEALDDESQPDPLVTEKDRQFWSFQPHRCPSLPEVRQKHLVRNPIDAFLLERLEAKGLGFSPEASRLVLMRRSYLDLIGLPPSPDEIDNYLNDSRPDAYERLIDRLLASPHYGERWGRYWLDAVGYADSEGSNNSDSIRWDAYRYRDYVIRSFNKDKPYDQFLLEQIAGDELMDYKSARHLTADQVDNLVATGFLRMAPDGTYDVTQNFIPVRLNVLADQVEIVSSAVMGLTMGCARCHSHKYDPIPQRDYYRFSAIFQTAYDPYDWLIPNQNVDDAVGEVDLPQRYLPYPSERERQEVEAYNAPIRKELEQLERSLEEKARPFREKLAEEKLAQLPEGLKEDVRKALKAAPGDRSDLQKYLVAKFEPAVKVERAELEKRFEDFKVEAEKLKKAIREVRKRLRPEPQIRALFDMGGEPSPAYMLRRGDYLNPGALVQAGVPSALKDGLAPYKVVKPAWKTDTSGRRLALARWLVQPNHPLTARVMVNRIWQHHFGTGLVSTPGNFGHTGARPSHPELLDWLAVEFVKRGWSLKTVHKLIMSSMAYRQSSRIDPNLHSTDPDNALLSRFPLQRMDADTIRDAILKVSQRLNVTPYGPADEVEVRPDGEVVDRCPKEGCRRSIYTLQRRSTPLTMLQVFDAPQLNPNCLKRPESTVSSQALQLWNSDLARLNSRYFAGRVIDAVGTDVDRQVERIYLTALSRWPTAEEKNKAREEIRNLNRHWLEQMEKEIPEEPVEAKAQWLALATFCHAIFNSAEFIYFD